MRNLNSIIDLNASIIGSMYTSGATALGAPIDTLGFKEVLAILIANSIAAGTNGNVGTIQINLQESATITGTGTAWSNINNGQVMGTCVMTIPFASGTAYTPCNNMMYERLQDGTRLRYVRLMATLSGTTSFGIRFAGGIMLGTPYDSGLVTNAVVQATGTTEFTTGI